MTEKELPPIFPSSPARTETPAVWQKETHSIGICASHSCGRKTLVTRLLGQESLSEALKPPKLFNCLCTNVWSIWCHFSTNLKRLPKKQMGQVFCTRGAPKDHSTQDRILHLPTFTSFLPIYSLTFTTSSTNPLWHCFFQQFPSAPSLRGLAVLPENSRFCSVIKGMALWHRAQVFKSELLRKQITVLEVPREKTSREILHTLLCTFYITLHSAILI